MTATAQTLTDAINRANLTGHGFVTPLLEAVRAGRIMVAYISDRSANVSLGQLKRSPLPVLAIIGDDDYRTTGPDGWTATKSWPRDFRQGDKLFPLERETGHYGKSDAKALRGGFQGEGRP